MNRNDYDDIKNRFFSLIKAWENYDSDSVGQYVHEDVKCYMGTCKDYTDGSRHSLNGLKGFIKETVPSEYLHMSVYNFLCRGNETEAKMTAIVCGVAADAQWQTCQFSFLFANTLTKENNEWLFSEIRFDLVENDGDYQEFFEPWYIGEKKAKWFPGVHLPVISGELDNPYNHYDVKPDLLSDEEQMQEAFSRYAFGIDTVSFENLDDVFSEDLLINMAPFGPMDKRTAMQTLKFHRQPDKFWIHPGKIETVKICGNEAYIRMYRMSGHRQRSNPLILTRDNINHEYACARYEIKMINENEEWKFLRMDYFLGVIDLGPYND